MHFALSLPVSNRPARYSYRRNNEHSTLDTMKATAHLSHVFQLLVILQEETEILVRNIHIRVPSQSPMLLLRLLASRKPVLVDLVLDLVRCVAHEDTRVRVGRAHLRLRALQCGEELGMQERRFRVFQFGSDVAGEAEVGILVDGTGDETRNVSLRAEDLRERVRK